MKATQQLYRVKLNNPNNIAATQQIDGYVGNNFNDGKVCLYSRGQALKKARLFDGKIEKEPAKVYATRYSIEELNIAQIPAKEIHKEILKDLEKSASFIDTDKTLCEFLVSTDTLNTLTAEYEKSDKNELAKLMNELYEQVAEYAYLHILTI